jgi:hypothetical protein
LKGGFCSDVWLSQDAGSTWTLKSERSPWAARSGFGVALNPNNPLDISIFGGSSANFVCLQDVWRSVDGGITWGRLADAPWRPRVDFGTVQLGNGDILIAGGDDWEGRFFNDLWISHDRGASWNAVSLNCDWSPRAGLAMVALNEIELVVICGNSTGLKAGKNDDQDQQVSRLGDVWKSYDGGKSWVQLCWLTELGVRTMCRAVRGKDGEIVLLGGWRENGFSADVWHSSGNKMRLQNEHKFLLDTFESTLNRDVIVCNIFPFLYGSSVH